MWLNTGGVQGECPLAQTPAVLETAGIPYIGHTPLNAALLDDKGMFKLACSGLGLPTAPFIVHNPAAGSFRPDRSAMFKRTFGSYQGPFIVKPVNGEAVGDRSGDGSCSNRCAGRRVLIGWGQLWKLSVPHTGRSDCPAHCTLPTAHTLPLLLLYFCCC